MPALALHLHKFVLLPHFILESVLQFDSEDYDGCLVRTSWEPNCKNDISPRFCLCKIREGLIQSIPLSQQEVLYV